MIHTRSIFTPFDDDDAFHDLHIIPVLPNILLSNRESLPVTLDDT